MNSGTFPACANCNEQATIKCERCHDAPPYEGQPFKKTYYCSAKCQENDCTNHKKVCDSGKDRISLSRAASLMKDIMLVWRKIAYPEYLEIVDRTPGRVAFKFSPPKDESARKRLKEFMVEMEEGDVRDGVILRNACTLAAMALAEFMQVLIGTIVKVQELAIEHKNIQLRLITPDNKDNAQDIVNHIVHKATTTSGEVWAIDVSGAQFGYPHPLESWSIYERDRVQGIFNEGELGMVKSTWLHRASFYENAVPLSSSALKQELHISEMLHEKFLQWLQPGGKLRGILEGTEEEFEGNKRAFLDDVEETIGDAMVEIETQRTS